MRRNLLLILSAFLLLVACDSESPETTPPPEGAEEEAPAEGEGDSTDIVGAFEQLGSSDALSARISLQSDASSLQAASQGSLDQDAADKILGSSLTLQRKGEAFQVIANIAGKDAFEMRFLDDAIFFRVDARELITTFGGDPAELQNLRGQAPPGLDFIGPALEGEFIALRGLEDLQRQLGGGAAAPQNAELQEKFFRDVATAFEQNATVTPAGSDEAGDHFVVEIPLRDMYAALSDTLGAASGGAGGLPPANQVPDESLPLDVWVQDGALSQLEFDIVKISQIAGDPAPDGVERLALRIEFDEFTGTIEAPSGATEVNVNEVLQGFLGGVGSGLGGTTGSDELELPTGDSDLCRELKQVTPPEELAQFESICPQFAR